LKTHEGAVPANPFETKSSMRTKKEISAEIWKLNAIYLQPRLPAGWLTNNRKAIKAQIETLESKDGTCPPWIWDKDDCGEDNLDLICSAFEASDWVQKRGESPSKSWEELLEFRMEPVEELEAFIGIPAKEWAGKCTEIARRLKQSKLSLGAKTTEHYGLWTGPIAKNSRFYGRPITHHGWLQRGDTIIDPTRWAFEGLEPYIYVGKNDFYDDGGQDFQMERIGQCPEPTGPAKFPAPRDPAAQEILRAEGVTQKKLTRNQAHHLANLPPKAYPKIGAIHKWLETHGMIGLIPIDFRRIAQPKTSEAKVLTGSRKRTKPLTCKTST
jgi:hypothetical protein